MIDWTGSSYYLKLYLILIITIIRIFHEYRNDSEYQRVEELDVFLSPLSSSNDEIEMKSKNDELVLF